MVGRADANPTAAMLTFALCEKLKRGSAGTGEISPPYGLSSTVPSTATLLVTCTCHGAAPHCSRARPQPGVRSRRRWLPN